MLDPKNPKKEKPDPPRSFAAKAGSPDLRRPRGSNRIMAGVLVVLLIAALALTACPIAAQSGPTGAAKKAMEAVSGSVQKSGQATQYPYNGSSPPINCDNRLITAR
jgi:hypothetical protein